MSKINDAAILGRARKLSKEDGFAWDSAASRTSHLWRILDDVGRRAYLTRAREQMLEEEAAA